MESVTNIRTLASFCNEERLKRIYSEKVDIPLTKGTKKSLFVGAAFGMSFFLMRVYYGLIFYIAAWFQVKEFMTLKDFFVALLAIYMTASATGVTSGFLPDLGAVVKGEDF